MYAIIRLGGGKYYTSAVFAHYNNISAADDYGKYTEEIYSRFYIVLNQEKTALIKQYVFDRKNEYLEPLILITDYSHDDWNMDEDSGFGEVNTVSKEEILSMAENGTVPEKFLEMDAACRFEEYNSISTEKDIENLMCVSGGFHDAYIQEQNEENGTLRILFEGTWGCKIEMLFSGELTYDTASRNPMERDPYWFGATLLINNGYICFADKEDVSVEDIKEGCCWFKARNLIYRVIPE
ncbi:MAG: hypothetical protein Q4D16_19080 [Eubacteriales bacterium]|nr:hypothetical protein [Eubacteriales bacterium]